MFDEKDHLHPHVQTRSAVIPTSEKLKADPERSGRGVVIAFLDSGFYPHPDIADRVIAYHDIHNEKALFGSVREPQGHHWHGTQTAVVCAGNGKLSDGIYRGIAHEARLVLVKVSKNGRIDDRAIERGLEWVIENRERLGIRIVNMSLGGDCDLSLKESTINQLAERLVDEGMVITVAAGNSADARPIPPASSPSVITVGGYSDENGFDSNDFNLYHSTHGETSDGIVKPELIAPAMYVAAPILPDTAEFAAAEVLAGFEAVPDYELRDRSRKRPLPASLEGIVGGANPYGLRRAIDGIVKDRKIVATHYQHVDGTSFAAPIVASVVAQMLEANPRLSPRAVKNILAATATKLSGRPAIRQGFGIVNASEAVRLAAKELHELNEMNFRPPRIVGREIVFEFHDDLASEISLVGDLNDWVPGVDKLVRCSDGIWRARIRCRPAGRYAYKFVIDGRRWMEDPSHGIKEPDGHDGFNSILVIG